MSDQAADVSGVAGTGVASPYGASSTQQHSAKASPGAPSQDPLAMDPLKEDPWLACHALAPPAFPWLSMMYHLLALQCVLFVVCSIAPLHALGYAGCSAG